MGGTAGSSTSSGGTAGSSTGMGGSAGSSTGMGGGAGTAGEGGAGGAGTLASCEASTDYPQIVGKTCADFCAGDQDVFGDGFLVVCAGTSAADSYGSTVEECENICNALTQDQLCCRFGHLRNAIILSDPATHCPHASGATPCN